MSKNQRLGLVQLASTHSFCETKLDVYHDLTICHSGHPKKLTGAQILQFQSAPVHVNIILFIVHHSHPGPPPKSSFFVFFFGVHEQTVFIVHRTSGSRHNGVDRIKWVVDCKNSHFSHQPIDTTITETLFIQGQSSTLSTHFDHFLLLNKLKYLLKKNTSNNPQCFVYDICKIDLI